MSGLTKKEQQILITIIGYVVAHCRKTPDDLDDELHFDVINKSLHKMSARLAEDNKEMAGEIELKPHYDELLKRLYERCLCIENKLDSDLLLKAATKLTEMKVRLKMLQECIGHAGIKIPEKYLHVVQRLDNG